MPDTLDVVYMHNAMRGAPPINGVAASLITALDALLLNGWGAASPSSVTVAGGVATATFATATSWEIGAVIQVTGASPTSLNGKSRVISATSTVLTFATAAPDGTYTGSSIKYAPAGWTKAFSGTNIAVYRSQDALSPKHYLRVRDSYGKYATVIGYEAMTAVSTGTGPFGRTTTLDNNQSTWEKSANNDSTPVNYLLAADSRAMLHAISPGVSSSPQYAAAVARGFGDPLPLSPAGDNWCTFLSSVAVDSGGSSDGSLTSGTPGSSVGGTSMPRAPGGTGSSRAVGTRPVSGSMNFVSGGDTAFGPAPSPVDGLILMSRMLFTQADGSARAAVPGVWYVPQNWAANLFYDKGMYLGSGELAGRRLCAVSTDTSMYSAGAGVFFVDVTGPWR